MNSPIVVTIGLALFCGLIFHMLPVWQRNGLFFGITVRPEFYSSSAYGQLVRNFRVTCWTSALTLWTLAAVLFPTGPNAIRLLSVGQILAALAAILWMRNQAKPWAGPANTVHSASLTAEQVQMPGSWVAFVIPLLFFPAAAWFLNAHWDLIPERFPIHYNAAGEVDRWADKTVKSVFTPLFFGFNLQLLLSAVAFGLAFGTRRAAPTGSRMRMLRASLWMMLILQWATAFMLCAIAIQPAMPNRSLRSIIWIAIGLIVITAFGFVFRLGNLKAEIPASDDNTPDQCWHLMGQIYYNPSDPALMVEKRIGVGYTVNTGNKLTWALLPFLILIALAPIVLFK